MDCLLSLAKHTFALGSTSFDIGSDFVNALNFMGYYNPSTNNTTSSNTTLYLGNQSSLMPDQMSGNHTMEEGYRQDVIWGGMGMALIFLPGVIVGFPGMIMGMYKRECGDVIFGLFWCIFFPLIVIFRQLEAIYKTITKSEVTQKEQLEITQLTAIEGTIESTGQMGLQLFTLCYGYQWTVIQLLTIATSFVQISRCSILKDISITRFDMGEEDLGFVESLKQTAKVVPLYLSSILFRIGSMVLIMVFLRAFALFPTLLIMAGLAFLSWWRLRNVQNEDNMLRNIFELAVSNMGVVYIYPSVESKEDPKHVKTFLEYSTLLITLVNSSTLVIILVLGWCNPTAFPHWSSTDFRIKPATETFTWFVIVLFIMAIFSVTTVFYRAGQIANTIADKKDAHDPVENSEKIPLQNQQNNHDQKEKTERGTQTE